MLMLKWRYARLKYITVQNIKGFMSKEQFITEFQKLQDEIYFFESLK